MTTTTTQPCTTELTSLLALGRTAQSWRFLEQALPALSLHPSEAGLTLLGATHLGKLGLRTGALALLDSLPSAIRNLPDIAALSHAITSLQDDALPNPQTLFEANLAALGPRLLGFDALQGGQPAAFFASTDGNIIAKRAGQWLGISDPRGQSTRILAHHRSSWRDHPYSALIIAGLRTPWLLKGASEARQRDKLGFRASIYVIEPDTQAFRDAMSMQDLTDELRDQHIRIFVGTSALADFEAFLHQRLDLRLSGSVAIDPHAPSSLLPAIEATLSNALHEQETQTRLLELAVHDRLRERDPAWWQSRFSAAQPPLRVLIPTTRYSTFVRHSSDDIASAFRALGHEAQILIEPDDSSTLAAGSYLRAFRDFDPDLVICINYPRKVIGDFLPRSVPWICWIQDQMPHLFDERIGASQGALDFTIGHVDPSLHERYGYPQGSSMVLAVPASETKFFASKVSESDRAKFECEIAYVSHQSETPEAQHERICATLRSDPSVDIALIRAMPRLRDAVQAHIALPLSTLPFPSMKQVMTQTLQESLGVKADDRIVDRIVTAYAEPLADRIMRHETLQWAADAARRNGWRFNLYGKGWENHPTLAPFAKGPLAHDSDLRLSYQLAGCHLQVTYHMLAHPRLCECVLSGGIPLCRLHWGERSMIETPLFLQAWHEGAEFRDDRVGEDVRRSPWTDAPSLMRFASVFQSLGCFDESIAPDDVGNCEGHLPGTLKGLRWGAPFHPRLVKDRSAPVDLANPSAFSMIGDQPELFFHDARTFEQRIAELRQSPDMRAVRNRVARKRISQRHTYRSAASQILSFLNQRLVPADKASPSDA